MIASKAAVQVPDGGAPDRILMSTDAVGGVWQYSLDLARGLSAAGTSVVLAVLGPPAQPAQRQDAEAIAGVTLVETGLPLDWLARDGGQIAESTRGLARLATATGARLAHLHSPALAAEPAFACPVVAVHHSCVATWWDAVRSTALPDDFVWRTDLVARGLRQAGAVIAPSAAFARKVAEVYALAMPPIAVPNGRSAAPASAGAEPADEVFTAGRLWDEGKGLVTLDAAARRLACPVTAAGPLKGPNGASLTLHHVTALGSLDEPALRARLARRPVYAAPALYEPFGLSVLEAAQAGCALVLSDIPTLRELWGKAALFVPPRDAAAWADALSRLLVDADERLALGKAAVQRAVRYSPEAMVAGTRAVHAAVLMRQLGTAA